MEGPLDRQLFQTCIFSLQVLRKFFRDSPRRVWNESTIGGRGQGFRGFYALVYGSAARPQANRLQVASDLLARLSLAVPTWQAARQADLDLRAYEVDTMFTVLHGLDSEHACLVEQAQALQLLFLQELEDALGPYRQAPPFNITVDDFWTRALLAESSGWFSNLTDLFLP